MRIAIIDADLIGRKRHRFPNLVCMKISAYHKAKGDMVELKTDYLQLDDYDQIYLSKVFTDTPVPEEVLALPQISSGGTGFNYDQASKLPDEIEHSMPDYHLYDDWVESKLAAGWPKKEFKYYTDYSIGFLTRGCFRKCAFCVNRKYTSVSKHSPLSEFYDPSRKKICLLDDNFFGCPSWKELLQGLQATNRSFQFKQGLDERLLTDEKCELLFSSKYDGDYIFAFDNIADAEQIESKIKLLRKYTDVVPKFYCFCAFDRSDRWDADFWRQDIFDLLMRIEILMKHRCLPYVMRFERYQDSPYRGVYISIARWCNQPSIFKKKSLREFADMLGPTYAGYRYLADFEAEFSEVGHFYDLRFPNTTRIID